MQILLNGVNEQGHNGISKNRVSRKKIKIKLCLEALPAAIDDNNGTFLPGENETEARMQEEEYFIIIRSGKVIRYLAVNW